MYDALTCSAILAVFLMGRLRFCAEINFARSLLVALQLWMWLDVSIAEKKKAKAIAS